MATPAYLGTAQPAGTGFLSCLSSLFGDQTPVYAGAGQPAASTSGLFCSSTPAYLTRLRPLATPCDPGTPQQVTIVIPREVFDAQVQAQQQP